jgi:hypothetical protein
MPMKKKSSIYEIVESNIDDEPRLKMMLTKNHRHGELNPELLDENQLS